MAATLTGTPVAIVWGSGANPAGQSITIPADCTAVYFFGEYYSDGAGTFASATLAGNAPSQTFEVPQNENGNTTWVAAWYNPPTGSQTLAVTFDDAPTEGPISIVVFVKGGDTTAWRDADGATNTLVGGAEALSVTLTTSVGDLVLKLDSRFGGTVPSLSAGWTSAQTQSHNGHTARLSYITATGTTQVANSEDENYSSLVAIAIPAAADTTIAGELDATLDPVAISAASSVDVAGSLGVALSPVTLGASAAVGINAQLGAALDPVSLSAAGAIAVTGDLNVTLDPVALAATASITDADVIAGQLSVMLDPVAMNTHAQVDVAGQIASMLGPVHLHAHIGERESARPAGGDDAPRRAVRHPGFNVRRARLRLQKDREFTESIRQIYRELVAEPVTRERAEEIVAPILGPVVARGESEEAYRKALEERALRIERLSVEAEIALRLLHQELRELLERDDEAAIAQLLGQVL